MTTKTVKPSSSYSLKLPAEVRESFEGTVSSFWIEGSPLLLQVSSYIRSEGKQLEAEHRLRERIAKDPGDWRVWSNKLCSSAIEQATGERTDETGVVWLHTYLVWPHLTIYVTISGPPGVARALGNWAIRAINSLRLTTQ
jgi:hypothetical protein